MNFDLPPDIWVPQKPALIQSADNRLLKANFLPGAMPGFLMAAPGNLYQANAVNFDGSTYLTRGSDLTGLSDGKTGLASVWFRLAANHTGIFYAADWRPASTTGGLDIGVGYDTETAGGPYQFIFIQGYNSSDDVVLYMEAQNANLSLGVWYHLLASWDAENSNVHLYLNDADDLAAASVTLDDDDAEFTTGDHAIGAVDDGGGFLFDGDIADLWFDTQYLDLSIEANRRLFINASGKPVDLGADGTAPGLGQPLVYMSGDTANWHTNKGAGGGFTENGTLTTAETSPSN